MKIRVTLKDPDTMQDAVTEHMQREALMDPGMASLTKTEREEISDERAGDIGSEIARRWMRYGEYLTVEFDTESWTATVVPASELK